jgi:methanogenic corrinoid protein MtbC1
MDRGISDPAKKMQDRLDQKLQNHDRAGAISDAVSAVRTGKVGLIELYEDVLTPLMVNLGTRWQAGKTQVWEEHLASTTIRGIIENLFDELSKIKASTPRNGRSVILACPREEQHDLGLRMLADRFEIAGWTAYFLGPDVPKNQIVDAAHALKAHAVVLSAATHFHRLRLRELVDQLRNLLPEVKIWVEGAAFHFDHEGWEEDELLDAAVLFNQERGES